MYKIVKLKSKFVLQLKLSNKYHAKNVHKKNFIKMEWLKKKIKNILKA